MFRPIVFYTKFLSCLCFMVCIGKAQAQRDTVFIRAAEDWTADSIVYQTDTVIFPSGMRRNILLGTCVLPGTYGQQNAHGYGLYLKSVSGSDCNSQGEPPDGESDRINFIHQTDTTLDIDIKITENCCHDFLCDIEIDSSGILHLMHHSYGVFCACACCFGLTYHFEKTTDPMYGTIRGIMIAGQRNTLKPVQNSSIIKREKD